MAWPRLTSRAALVAMLAATALAATALAGVVVYGNNFSSRAKARQLEHVDGKRCDRKWRKKAESVRVEVTRGPESCVYSPPVMSDSDGPDHGIQAKEKLLKRTPKSVRDGAFLAIAVRAGRSDGYQLRVFPNKHKFELRRSPSGGGADFPAHGTSRRIKRTGKPNVLRLNVVDDKVTAKVNGHKLARVTDSNPAEVGGRKLEVTVGGRKHSRKSVLASVDDVRVQVPKP